MWYTSSMIVTIDTGGTKTLITSFNKKGEMGESLKYPTPQDPKEYVRVLKQTVRERYGDKKVDCIVLAIPGVIVNNTVKWCGNLPWRNIHMGDLLADMLPGVPITIGNDAKIAALGAARSLRDMPASVLYITVSTGIGAGLVTNGHINQGMIYSEVGRTPLEFDGRVRIWESFASGRAIVETYKQYARDITSKRIWRQVADRISRGFLVIIPIIQPDLIVIGGSIGTYFSRYDDYLRDILKRHLPEHIKMPRIARASHPEEAVIYGCYYYGIDFLADQQTRK